MNDYYGDNVRWFMGIVEDNRDPMRLGRVRVRVFGLHTSEQDIIQTSDLPWSQVMTPSTEGGVSGIGLSPNISVGSQVFGMFMDGMSSQLPLVLGSIPSIEDRSPVQTQTYPDNAPFPDVDYNSVGAGTGAIGQRNRGIGSYLDQDEIERRYGGQTNALFAFNYFVDYGFTPIQAAGIVGNLMQESGPELDTSVKAAGTERSFGIAQWNAGVGRYQLLREYANDLGRNWTDIDVQVNFIIYELENYPYLGLANLKNANTLEEAVIAFQDGYEKPGIPKTESRLDYARAILRRASSAI